MDHKQVGQARPVDTGNEMPMWPPVVMMGGLAYLVHRGNYKVASVLAAPFVIGGVVVVGGMGIILYAAIQSTTK